MDRRTLLRGGLAGMGGIAATGLLGCAPAPGAPPTTVPVDPGPFDCGVASGVHTDTEVVLWTRFAPSASTAGVEVVWQVATDPSFDRIVATGTGVGSVENDGCVKVLAQGLAAGTTYWYRFMVDGLVGPSGRTRTLPAAGAALASARFAVTSCQNWSAGFYPAWRAIAAEELDAVIFLGDYIYESDGGAGPLTVRPDTAGAATDLASYRAKYRMHRSDPDLRAAHAAHPFAPVWDDHEFVNDCDRLTLLEQPDRAAAAYRTWFEYQPVWRIDGDRIHRRHRWGRLVDLSMLDLRQYRDPHPRGADGRDLKLGSTLDLPARQVHDVGRTIMGDAQREWFLDGMGRAQADDVTWKLVGNQVMISPIRIIDLDEPALRGLLPDLPDHAGVYANFDDWSGYMWERDLVTDHLGAGRISNVGFLTGDIHSFWQSAVQQDVDAFGSPVVAQEFVCGSVSSRGLDYVGDLAVALADGARQLRPGFRHVDLVRRGFGLVECTPEAMSVEYRTVDAITANRDAPATRARRRVRFDWPAGTHTVSVTRG